RGSGTPSHAHRSPRRRPASASEIGPVVVPLRARTEEDDAHAGLVLLAQRSTGPAALGGGDLAARRGRERECRGDEESGDEQFPGHGTSSGWGRGCLSKGRELDRSTNLHSRTRAAPCSDGPGFRPAAPLRAGPRSLGTVARAARASTPLTVADFGTRPPSRSIEDRR